MSYVDIARRRWGIVAATLVIALVAAWWTGRGVDVTTDGTPQTSTLYEAEHTLRFTADEEIRDLGLTDMSVLASSSDVATEAERIVRAELGDAADRVPPASATTDDQEGLITFTATSRDPELTAATANAHATALRSYATERADALRQDLIADTEAGIERLRQQLLETESVPPSAVGPAAEIARIEQQTLLSSFSAEVSRLATLRSQSSSDATFLFTLEPAVAYPADTDVVSLGPPAAGVGRFGYAGALGLVLGLGLALLVEHVDPRVHSRREVAALLGAPVIGDLVVSRWTREPSTPWTVPTDDLRRLVRSLQHLPRWLLAGSADDPVGRRASERAPSDDFSTVMVVSLGPAGDSATVAARLGAAAAQDELDVSLVDLSAEGTGLRQSVSLRRHRPVADTGPTPAWEVEETHRPGVLLVRRRTTDGSAPPEDPDQLPTADLTIVDAGRLQDTVEGLGLLGSVDAVIVVAPLAQVTAPTLSAARDTLAHLDAPVVGAILLDLAPLSVTQRSADDQVSVTVDDPGSLSGVIHQAWARLRRTG